MKIFGDQGSFGQTLGVRRQPFGLATSGFVASISSTRGVPFTAGPQGMQIYGDAGSLGDAAKAAARRGGSGGQDAADAAVMLQTGQLVRRPHVS